MPERTGAFETRGFLDGVLLARSDGTLLRANPAACRAVGRSENDICRDGLSALVVQDGHLRDLLTTAATSGSVAGELTFRRSDGSTFPAEVTSGLIPSDGDVPLLYVSFRDITELRRSQEEQHRMREREVMLTGITDALADPIVLRDREGRWVFANPAMLEAIGKSLDQVQGKTDREIDGGPRIGEATTETDRRIMESGVPEMVEETIQTGDGYRVHLFSKAPFRDRDGRIAGIVSSVKDITERKRAEDARFRHVFEQAYDGIYVVSADNRYLDVNERGLTLLGYTRDELLRMSVADVLVPQDVARLAAELPQMMAGVPYLAVWDHARKDGSIFPGEVSARRLNDHSYMAIVRDLTDRRQAEEAQREAHDRLAKIVATAPGIVCSFRLRPDGSTCLPFGGERIAAHYGIPLARLTEDAAPFLALTHPDDLDRLWESVVESARHLSPWRREWRVRHPAGGERWIECQSVPLREPDGSTLWHGVAVDVTERRRAEAALREALEREHQAVSAGDVGLWDWDLRSNRVRYSQEWKRQIGYADDEISDDFTEWQTRVHPDDLDRSLNAVQAFLASARLKYEIEFRFRHKDGSYRHILARGSVVRDEQGQPTRMLGSHVDVTERTELQAQFLQAQRMESVGRLAGGVAHDFNNLLTVINGTAELAMEGLREGDPLRDDLDAILQAGQRGAMLTRQLLAFSRKQVLQPTVLDLNAAIADMQKMLTRLIGEDVALSFTPMKELGRVRADPGQIEQVLMNLAVNARDAMPRGGTMTIATANVDLDETCADLRPSVVAGPYVMISVSDTGIGMDQATQTRIFEPFFTTKGTGKGTGLGLSTVYGIVTQSGGHVGVYSEVGKGTSFRIHLPRVDAVAEPDRSTQSGSAERGSETILLVEDDETLRRLAERALKSAGYRVLVAASGGEALLLLERFDGPVHLLLTDVVMPGMSGRELADRLRETGRDMRVLFSSGYTDDVILHHGVLNDQTHFISKPYSVAALTRKVSDVLRG